MQRGAELMTKGTELRHIYEDTLEERSMTITCLFNVETMGDGVVHNTKTFVPLDKADFFK